jgi:dTMP kinase
MEQKQGQLIVIEGGDGTGKETQAKMLVTRLIAEGHKAVQIDFPRYGNPPDGNPASFSVRKYLQKKDFGHGNGYGHPSSVNPYGASLIYAIDRFDAAFCRENKPNMWDLINEGTHIVSNRYTESNIGYQAAKIDDKDRRLDFIRWLIDMEYEKIGIPKPKLVVLLDLDPVVARQLKAQQRKEQGQELDAHEKDAVILDKARVAYLEAAELFKDSWAIVDVATKAHPANKSILASLYAREVVHEKVWTQVKRLL